MNSDEKLVKLNIFDSILKLGNSFSIEINKIKRTQNNIIDIQDDIITELMKAQNNLNKTAFKAEKTKRKVNNINIRLNKIIKKKYTCKFCNKHFFILNNLKKHMKEFHIPKKSLKKRFLPSFDEFINSNKIFYEKNSLVTSSVT